MGTRRHKVLAVPSFCFSLLKLLGVLAMTTVFKRLPIGGAAQVFKASKIYRPGSSVPTPTITAMPLNKALAAAKTNVTFLEVETLKGLPVNKSLDMKTIDPYLACYAKDMHTAYFSKK